MVEPKASQPRPKKPLQSESSAGSKAKAKAKKPSKPKQEETAKKPSKPKQEETEEKPKKYEFTAYGKAKRLFVCGSLGFMHASSHYSCKKVYMRFKFGAL